MPPHRGITILILIILLSGITSCAAPSTTSLPVLTQTSTSFPPATSTSIPTTPPTLAPSPSPSDTQAATPVGAGYYLPIGVATAPSAGGPVIYYDLQGQVLGELQSPNLGAGLYQQAHIAGELTLSPSTLLPPLVFYAFENSGELWLSDSNNLSLITAAANLFSMVGIPGKPTLAYSLIEYTDIGVRSRLYIGDPQTLPTANSILDSTNSQSYAIKPMAISVAENQATGVWYTTVPYGIGGDIVFEPRSTLNYVDLTTLSTNDFLGMTKAPAGISDDQTWVAYTSNSGNVSMNIVHNFDFPSATIFPLREDSDRGSGDAVFSPDNQYVAWREAGGSLMEQPSTFHQTIRIATLDGNVITDLPDTDLIDISGFSEISWVVPIGWLDVQTLALEVKDINGNTANILSARFDGTGLAYLAPGEFIGFLYP